MRHYYNIHGALPSERNWIVDNIGLALCLAAAIALLLIGWIGAILQPPPEPTMTTAQAQLMQLDGALSTPLPRWVYKRQGWTFCGWISRQALDYEGLVIKARTSDHRELRGVDEYPSGAICWWKERGR